jgi:hypothetical protein
MGYRDAEKLTESIPEEGRTIGVPSRLRATYALLAVAFVTCLVVAFISFRCLKREVIPECHGVLEHVDYEPPAGWSFDRLPGSGAFGPTKDTLRVEIDPFDRSTLRVVRMHPEGSDSLMCGAIPIYGQNAAFHSPNEFTLFRGPHDVYVAVQGGNPPSPFDATTRAVVFRTVEVDEHVWQAGRLFSPRALTVVISVAAIFSLLIALVRSRRGIAYATKLHAWTEGELGDGGRVLTPEGEALGIVSSSSAWIGRGPVLVAPRPQTDTMYREMRILDRRDVAQGSHAAWATITMRGLRDARALAIVSTACSALALAGHLLGA